MVNSQLGPPSGGLGSPPRGVSEGEAERRRRSWCPLSTAPFGAVHSVSSQVDRAARAPAQGYDA